MSETVVAVHKVTGIISEVPAHLLDLIPALEKATDKQIKAAQKEAEIAAYGEPLKNGEIPDQPVATAKTEGDAANG